METSILTSTKKVLGLSESYTAFDLDIIIHINSTFSVLTQLGVGPSTGFSIEDDTTEWEDFIETNTELYNMVKTYMCLKVRLLFDPPATSFAINAFENQIREYEWRMTALQEFVPWEEAEEV
jgi:hypothetical protein